MDETPIWADVPSATTIDRRGVQAVPIRTTGHEKNRLTVCLAVKADGTKMTPYVVIQAKKFKKELADISGVIVAATPNGWMNDNLAADWVEKFGQIFPLPNVCLYGIHSSAIYLKI